MDDNGVSLAVGSGAVGAICGVVGAWLKARVGTKAKVEPVPLPVEQRKGEVEKLREEFERHVAENSKEHEALYSRMNRNDRETSEIKGMLGTMMDDLRLIKNKLLKTRS